MLLIKYKNWRTTFNKKYCCRLLSLKLVFYINPVPLNYCSLETLAGGGNKYLRMNPEWNSPRIIFHQLSGLSSTFSLFYCDKWTIGIGATTVRCSLTLIFTQWIQHYLIIRYRGHTLLHVVTDLLVFFFFLNSFIIRAFEQIKLFWVH